MTNQPTAPQTWDTLPADLDDIPFPIVLGWEARKPATVNWTAMADGHELFATWTRYHGDPDWWMPWPTFTPDPMTVNDWHDMALLPDGHPEWVWIEYEDGRVQRAEDTHRQYDAEYGRKRWRSEAAMLAHVGGTVEGERNA